MLILCQTGFSQSASVIIDAMSKEKIPFVNVWIQDKNIGTTSNFNGEFQLNYSASDTIVFSAIGYETKKIYSDSMPNLVTLTPIVLELGEVVALGHREHLSLTIGEFKKPTINYFFSCGTNPWIAARYFPNDTSYAKTRYISKLSLVTKSRLENSKFYVRLYKATEDGKPGDYLFTNPIMGVAKKGKKTTELDLTDLHLKFPEHGLFVAIEWLIIEENKYEFTYTKNGSNKKFVGVSYEPKIGVIPSETAENSWIYIQGKWMEIIQDSDNKYSLLALKLELEN